MVRHGRRLLPGNGRGRAGASRQGVFPALGLPGALHAGAGDDILLAAFALLGAVGLISGYLANIPVVAATIIMVKGYLVLLQLVPEEALGTGFTEWQQTAFPVFAAMMSAVRSAATPP